MLKRIRVIVSVTLAIVAVVAITTAAIGTAIHCAWISKLQIIPLILSAGVPWLITWVVITFIFGRVYCSSVCPLGTLQDCISNVSMRARKTSYRYAPPVWSVRWFFLIIMLVAITGFSLTLTLILDPYYSFNKIIAGVAIPAFTLGAIYVTIAEALSAVLVLIIVLFLSAFWGRRLCNTICPVGTGLGLLSVSPVFRIDINTDRCIGCNKCVEVCKSSCIDPWSHTVDPTRCVVCFNCLNACNNKAISYTCRRYRLRHPLLMQNRTNATISRPSQRHS